mmetsp:Transcript_63/g.201  ORF Transcript_63/g.201 Transcript_63/m.201 type:complete len:224 (-) Transcript_63:1245-1916(-)
MAASEATTNPPETTEAEIEEGEITSAEEVKAKPTPSVAEPHPLEHAWTLWFDNPSHRHAKSTWGQSLRSVCTFRTVEDFWRLFNNVVAPSKLVVGADFYLFKEGIEPKWEDPKCANGGKWTVLVPKNANPKQTLDTYWLHTILAMIGEQFDEGHDLCGVVANIRARQDRVAIWTKTASKEEVQMSIGKQLKEVLDIAPMTTIGFLSHADAKNLDRKAKDKYTV